MERVLTQEEKIKRAEEIYLRRKLKDNFKTVYSDVSTVKQKHKNNTSKLKLIKRVAIQIIICLLLYCIFYLIYDTNYSFSDITIVKIKEILSYDINFDNIYKNINKYIMSLFPKTETDTMDTEENNSEVIENITENSSLNNTIEKDEEVSQIDEVNNEIRSEEKIAVTTEEEKDINKYKLIVPVNGSYISSRFGARESNSEIISTNHKGIDLAVSKRNKYILSNAREGNNFYSI